MKAKNLVGMTRPSLQCIEVVTLFLLAIASSVVFCVCAGILDKTWKPTGFQANCLGKLSRSACVLAIDMSHEFSLVDNMVGSYEAAPTLSCANWLTADCHESSVH